MDNPRPGDERVRRGEDDPIAGPEPRANFNPVAVRAARLNGTSLDDVALDDERNKRPIRPT